MANAVFDGTIKIKYRFINTINDSNAALSQFYKKVGTDLG